jgi:hypothetical protein
LRQDRGARAAGGEAGTVRRERDTAPEGDAMGDEKDVAEAAVQLVKQLALACASLIVGREKGLLSDANLDVARVNEWVDSFATDSPPARKMFNAFLRSEVERLRRET